MPVPFTPLVALGAMARTMFNGRRGFAKDGLVVCRQRTEDCGMKQCLDVLMLAFMKELRTAISLI